MVISKGEKVKTAISLGVEVETAIALFDALEKMERPKISDARKARNERYYEKNQSSILDKQKALRRAEKTRKDAEKTLKTLAKTPEPEMFLAEIGTPEHDAWAAYWKQTKRRSIPRSDKENGWRVPSPFPPNHQALKLHPI